MTNTMLFKITRTDSGYLRRLACWVCSVNTTRKHSTYSYPCCEHCESVLEQSDPHEACHLTQGTVATLAA